MVVLRVALSIALFETFKGFVEKLIICCGLLLLLLFAMLTVWISRFFGAFGGPVPV